MPGWTLSEVDLDILVDVLQHHLADLLDFVAAVRGTSSAPRV